MCLDRGVETHCSNNNRILYNNKNRRHTEQHLQGSIMSGSSSRYYVPTRTKTPTCALANSPSIDGETRHQKTKLFKPQARVVVDFVNELMPYVASQRTPRGRQAMKLCVAFNYSCPLITFRMPLSHGSTTRCK